MADLTFLSRGSLATAKRNCNSGLDLASGNLKTKKIGTGTIDPAGIPRYLRAFSKIHETFLRLKATSRERPRACPGRRGETKSPRCPRNGGGSGDGIKER